MYQCVKNKMIFLTLLYLLFYFFFQRKHFLHLCKKYFPHHWSDMVLVNIMFIFHDLNRYAFPAMESSSVIEPIIWFLSYISSLCYMYVVTEMHFLTKHLLSGALLFSLVIFFNLVIMRFLQQSTYFPTLDM